MIITRTRDTMRQHNDAIEVARLANRQYEIEVWSQDDDGEWHSRMFIGEAAAAEFEAKGRKLGFRTRRG